MSESEITEFVRKYRAIIIFSNQRTGSTSLMNWFIRDHKKYTQYDKMYEAVQALGYEVYESNNAEIFDIDIGVFRDVVFQYNKDKNIEKLELAIKTIMSFRPSFRIINEYLPLEISQIISNYINYFHYSAIFLHRRKTIERLLSLWFSLKTDIYHPTNSEKIAKFKTDKKKIPKIDVKFLIDNQKQVNDANVKIWEILRKAGCRYVAISYEDLYSDMSDSTILHICFRWLFYQVWDFTEIKQKGKMNLNKYYYEMKGIEELEQALEKIDKPNFANMHVDV